MCLFIVNKKKENQKKRNIKLRKIDKRKILLLNHIITLSGLKSYSRRKPLDFEVQFEVMSDTVYTRR